MLRLSLFFLLLFCSLFIAQKLYAKPTFQDLQQIIKNPANRIVDTKSFLQFISEDPYLKGFLKNSVFNERSFALHSEEVSPEYPRIMMHLDDMMLMFVGDPSKKSSNMLEIIEFDQKERIFKFSFINFLSKDARGKYLDIAFIEDASEVDGESLMAMHDSYRGANGRPEILKCSRCHDLSHSDKELRPRWSNSLLWQTPYAKLDDRIYKESKQFVNWQNFIEKTYKHPEKGILYRFFPLPKTILKKNEKNKEFLEFVDRPNLSLAVHNNRLNNMRIARLIQEDVDYQKKQFAIAAAFLNCNAIPEFFPYSVNQQQRKVLTDVSKTYNMLPLDRNSIHVEEFLVHAQTTIRPDRQFDRNSDNLYLSRKEMIRFGKFGLIENYQAWIDQTNLHSTKVMIERGANRRLSERVPLDFSQHMIDGVFLTALSIEEQARRIPYEDKKFSEILAKLGYILEGNISENIEFWSTDSPFPSTSSYRLSNGVGETNVLEVFKKYLLPRLIASAPTLKKYSDFFKQYSINSQKNNQICQDLRELSLAAYKNIR